MERSKRLAISDKEREEIKRREIEQKATGFFHRYVEGHLSLTEILKEIAKMDERTQAAMKEILLSQWMDALSLNDEDEKLLKGIESLKSQSLDELRGRLRGLSQNYSEEKEHVRQKIREETAVKLREMGIYGSAVEPNVTGNKAMEKLLEGIDLAYRGKLRDVKEALRKL